jgi:aspartokinase
MSLVVMKFGGTSVEDPAAIKRTADIVAGRVSMGKQPIVVVSAMAKVTDSLLRAANAASTGDRTGALAILILLAHSSKLRQKQPQLPATSTRSSTRWMKCCVGWRRSSNLRHAFPI